jgi:hypothetical protein
MDPDGDERTGAGLPDTVAAVAMALTMRGLGNDTKLVDVIAWLFDGVHPADLDPAPDDYRPTRLLVAAVHATAGSAPAEGESI